MLKGMQETFRQWALRGRAPEPVPVVLSRHRIYVLPTRAGFAFGLTLVVMFLSAVNYSLSLGHALVFLLAGLGLAAILATFRNMVDLRISPGHATPVFAGETARFGLVLDNPRPQSRYNLHLTLPGIVGASTLLDELPALDSREVSLPYPASRRGRIALPRLTLETRFPLGLIRTWSYAAPAFTCLVYPAPAIEAPPLPEGAGSGEERQHQGAGQDDFADLRRHRPGDPLQHVAWKAAARLPDSPLLTKQFAGYASRNLWLDWASLPGGISEEQGLSILARWVLDAQAARLTWGLRIRDREILPASGPEHMHRCLEALALYGLD